MLICDQGIEQNAFIEMGCVKSNVRHIEKKTHYTRTGNQNDFNDTGEKEILCLRFIQNHVRCTQKRQKCAQNQGEMLCMCIHMLCIQEICCETWSIARLC